MDIIGRVFATPFANGPADVLQRLSLGASAWHGQRDEATAAMSVQSTAAGYKFMDDKWNNTDDEGEVTAYQRRQYGKLRNYAGELNWPLSPTYGVRAEALWKSQELAVFTSKVRNTTTLAAFAGDAMAWLWQVGNDSIVSQDSTQAIPCAGGAEPTVVRDGLQLLVRGEYLTEYLVGDPGPGNPSDGAQARAAELGINYWKTKRFLATVSYNLHHFENTGEAVLRGGSFVQQEVVLRLAIAL